MSNPASDSMTYERVRELANYVHHRASVLDRDLLPYGNPRGKDVLVFGYGLGNEILWCARHGARSVVGVDQAPIRPKPLEYLLKEENHSLNYELYQENIHDTATKGRRFDLIVSNGTFEHVMDLKGVLSAFRPLLTGQGRIAIFADALYNSSIGGHIGRDRWEHLWMSPAEIKAEIPHRWDVWCNRLNRMTSVDFLEAIRTVGLAVHQFKLNRDPHLRDLSQYLDKISAKTQVNITDLSIVSIGCELSFVENI